MKYQEINESIKKQERQHKKWKILRGGFDPNDLGEMKGKQTLYRRSRKQQETGDL